MKILLFSNLKYFFYNIISYRLQGDLVQLKEMHIPPTTELKSKAMDFLVMTHGLRHENMNPFIGKYLFDCKSFYTNSF